MKKPIYLLDTNIISELTRLSPNPKVASKINELKNSSAISSTTWNELLFGIGIMPSGRHKDYYFSYIVDNIRSAFPILPYDSHAAWIHADLRTRLKEVGKIKSFQDSQIASIAISNQLVLVTRNMDDFKPMQEVSNALYLENWFE